MAYTKKPLKDKVKPDKQDKKRFTLEPSGANEETVFLVFSTESDASKAAKIDKLSVVGLPTSGAGVTDIVWVNNFWLKKADDNYLNDVTYHLQLKDHPGKSLVYFDGVNVLAYQQTPVQLPNGFIEISLNIGDPGLGWGGKG